MSDFMKWLYANYISPRLTDADWGEYEPYMAFMDTKADALLRESYEKAMEFTALHAFLIGLRAGQSLCGK